MLCPNGEATNINFYSLWFDPIGLEPMIYGTRGEHANHYTTDTVLSIGNPGLLPLYDI